MDCSVGVSVQSGCNFSRKVNICRFQRNKRFTLKPQCLCLRFGKSKTPKNNIVILFTVGTRLYKLKAVSLPN